MDFGWHLPCYGRLATRENLLLVAREAEIEYPLARVNQISARVPCICKVSPSKPDVHLEDVAALA